MTSGCMSPHTHTIIPLTWRERDSFPHQGNEHAHFTSTKGNKAQGKEGTRVMPVRSLDSNIRRVRASATTRKASGEKGQPWGTPQ
eukprot:scaffold24269_cov118-Isochrysis_galbana.AAC.1